MPARAETGGSFELAISDEMPRGKLYASIGLEPAINIKGLSLSKGCLSRIENHTLQSGVLALPDYLESPLIIGGIDHDLLDGVHLHLEVFWQEQIKRGYLRLFNSILNICIAEAPELQPAARLL